MAEEKRQEMTKVQQAAAQKADNPFDSLRENPLSAAILKDNHLMRCCAKEGLKESDERHRLAVEFGKIIPLDRIDIDSLGIIKSRKHRQYRHYELSKNKTNENATRHGMSIDKVFKIFKTDWEDLKDFKRTIEETA